MCRGDHRASDRKGFWNRRWRPSHGGMEVGMAREAMAVQRVHSGQRRVARFSALVQALNRAACLQSFPGANHPPCRCACAGGLRIALLRYSRCGVHDFAVTKSDDIEIADLLNRRQVAKMPSQQNHGAFCRKRGAAADGRTLRCYSAEMAKRCEKGVPTRYLAIPTKTYVSYDIARPSEGVCSVRTPVCVRANSRLP